MNKDINFIDGGITAPKGFLASGMQVGISHKVLSENEEAPKSKKKKNDVGLIYSTSMCQASAVYTQNKVKGAPITITQNNLSDFQAQAVIVNSKNANTCNADGEQKAQMMCDMAAVALKLKPSDIIVASTGVIGQVLDVRPIKENITKLVNSLSQDGNDSFAQAILTTDLVKKEYAVSFKLDDVECKIGGVAKGSGMIEPNMATMLGFITTDVAISSVLLDKALRTATNKTFNCISVDGDTSTNDMVSIMANAQAENKSIENEDEHYDIFLENLLAVMTNLAKDIAKDGEGATKLLECQVSQAPSEEIAQDVAKTIIKSSLVKTAMFGADANWGRVLCAIGYSKYDFDIHKVDVSFSSSKGQIQVCKNGSGLDFSEEKAKEILLEKNIQILVSLNQGSSCAFAWGCDLSYDYVKINGDYRS